MKKLIVVILLFLSSGCSTLSYNPNRCNPYLTDCSSEYANYPVYGANGYRIQYPTNKIKGYGDVEYSLPKGRGGDHYEISNTQINSYYYYYGGRKKKTTTTTKKYFKNGKLVKKEAL